MSERKPRHEIDGVRLPVLLYAVFASLWILFSDQFLAGLIHNPVGLMLGSTIKGLTFVGVTTLLLYRLLDRQRRTRQSLAATEAIRLAQEGHLKALHLMAAIADSSQDAIFAQDREGRFILFNRAAERNSGKTADQVLGRGEAAIFPPEMAARLLKYNRAVLESGQAREFEETLTFPGGERTVWTTKGPLFDQDGRVVGLFGISRDITAQQQAARALRESEERLRLLIDHAPVALALFDHDMRYLALSRHWREDFEIGERDVLGLSHYEVFPDLPEKWKEAHRRGLAGETVSSDGDRYERRDGATIWSRWEVLPWRHARGDIGGILILAENITERKQAEDALKESESRFRALVEQSLAGIYIIQDGRFRYVNPGFAAMFGYASAAEIIERLPVAELVMPEDRVRVAENVRQRVEGQVDDLHYTFAGRCRDGSRIEVEVHGRRFDYQGRPAVIGLILDITARKAAEDALRESELRFHDIVDASADWVWEVDAKGRYTYASESVRDLLGYGPEELLGRTPFDLMPPDEAARVAAQFAACVASKAPFRDLENINLRKDGQPVHVASNGMPILDGVGQLLGYRGLDRDITERKLAEAELKARNDELERFNRATVGRELDMLEMKKTINALSRQLGREAPYPLAFLRDGEGGVKP